MKNEKSPTTSTNNLFLYDATPFISLVILTSFFHLLSTNLLLLLGKEIEHGSEGLIKEKYIIILFSIQK